MPMDLRVTFTNAMQDKELRLIFKFDYCVENDYLQLQMHGGIYVENFEDFF